MTTTKLLEKQQSILDSMLGTAKVASRLADRPCPVSKLANAKSIGMNAIPAFMEDHSKEGEVLCPSVR